MFANIVIVSALRVEQRNQPSYSYDLFFFLWFNRVEWKIHNTELIYLL